MANLTPSTHFVDLVSKIVSSSADPIRVAEIGVDRGATTIEIARVLREFDQLDLFDYERCTLFKQIGALRANSLCQIRTHPNSSAIYDSYAWTLGKIYLENLKTDKTPTLWDAVYLDGAHTFPVDAPATYCLKEMVKIGGFIVFDDMQWSLLTSPTCNTPEMRERFTDEQMAARHVEMVVKMFMRSDNRFSEETDVSDLRSIFVRKF